MKGAQLEVGKAGGNGRLIRTGDGEHHGSRLSAVNPLPWPGWLSLELPDEPPCLCAPLLLTLSGWGAVLGDIIEQ